MIRHYLCLELTNILYNGYISLLVNCTQYRAQLLQILRIVTQNLGHERLEFISSLLSSVWFRMSRLLLVFCLMFSPSLSSPPVPGQGMCAVGWLDGGATLGCIFLDNSPMSWLEAIMYCRDLSVTGVTSSISLAKMTR